MSDPSASSAQPRCQQCGTPLVPAAMPRGVFGIEGEACVECDDASSARQEPWACPKCGSVCLLDRAQRR